jgi:flavin reductase (DIM6/NTAB) family NADH-FMN oxidoreductase RutF/predicted ester cyclase
MHELNEQLLLDVWQAVWDRGDVDALDRIVTPDYVRASSRSATIRTLQDVKAEIRAIRAAFPDLSTHVDAVIAGGEEIAVFWTSEGTHSESFLGVPPTHRRVRTSGSNRLRVSGDRILSETVTWDGTELLEALGIRSLSDARTEHAEHSTDVVEDLTEDPGPQALKAFNRQFVTGVTIVTTVTDGLPKGLAVNSYASISLEPPLVLVCIQKTSSTYPALFSSSYVGINILSTEQVDTVNAFSRSSKDKFEGVDWHAGPQGSPLIDGSSASIEAEIRDRFQAQTHTLFVCRARHSEISDADPMIYRAGAFFDSHALQPL